MFRSQHHGMFLTFQATCMLWPQVGPIVWLHLPCQSAALLKGSPAKGHPCKRATMSKWKREKWDAASTNPSSDKGLTPLGSCLLENFANGMSASWLHIPPHVQLLVLQLLICPSQGTKLQGFSNGSSAKWLCRRRPSGNCSPWQLWEKCFSHSLPNGKEVLPIT